MIRLIAALDVKRGLAVDSGIPWTIPADTAHFRDETTSGVIVMGWRTYEEFAAPLHDRTNYVFDRSPETLRPGFRTTPSLAELEVEHPDEDIWVIGGAAVYAATIGTADELVLTQVLADFHCTKFFPPYEHEFTRTQHGADVRDGDVRYRFETWRRSGAASP